MSRPTSRELADPASPAIDWVGDLQQTRVPGEDDDVDLEVALGMAAATFRVRNAEREHSGRAQVYRSERETRLGRAYLKALRAFIREGAAARASAP